MKHYLQVFSLLFFVSFGLLAQYTIKGRVTDAATGEPLPFVILQFKGTNIGAQTDFDGYYLLKSKILNDSLKATYSGYIAKSRKLNGDAIQNANFQLFENTQQLGEVVVKRGENPAWSILRKVQNQKDANDKRNLDTYEYESYIKTQIDMDNISKKMRKNVLMKPIIAAIDSMKKVTNDEGKPIIPIYISETMAYEYYQNNPSKLKENIIANKVIGVLDESNSQFLTQLTGSTFTDFNFYQNNMRFLGKDFISPIAATWNEFYNYDLEDSLYIGSDFCYLINIKPKRAVDLAFTGRIWVAKKDYGLKRVDLSIGKGTNINFVEKIKIQQDFIKTETGPYLTSKLRFLVNMADIGDSTAGLLVKFYVSNKNIKLNNRKPSDFFDIAIEINENATEVGKEDYFKINRHDSLTSDDKQVMKMVDTIRNIPAMRNYITFIDVVINGHKKIGGIEFGPYLSAIAVNNVEGLRLRMGFRTNMKFSKRLLLRGFIAYGTKDEKLKYGGGFDYWISKKKWFLIGADHTFDIDQVALHNNVKVPGSGLFYTFARWGNLTDRLPFYYSTTSLYAQIDYLKGCTQKIQFNYEVLNPINNGNKQLDFGFYDKPHNIPVGSIDPDSNKYNTFLTLSEIVFESRFAKNETYLFNDHRRISSRVEKLPIVTFKYILGFRNVFGSQFDYHKFILNLYQRFTVGQFGQSSYSINAFYTPSAAIFPILNVALGNNTIFYNPVAFSTMNFFEFVTDKSVSLNYQHHFNGYFFNKIPLFSKLKWREVVSCNVLWGALRNDNLNLIPNVRSIDGNGESTTVFKSPQNIDPNIPFVEVGYGIENIFKLFRVELYHRLNYLDVNYPISRLGVKIGVQFTL